MTNIGVIGGAGYVGLVTGKEQVYKNEELGNVEVLNGEDKVVFSNLNTMFFWLKCENTDRRKWGRKPPPFRPH